MISILTHKPDYINKEKIKVWAKKVLGRERGPEMVLGNLTLGLQRMRRPFLVNKVSKETKKIHVLSSISALKWAIEQKKKGGVSEIIAGPNLVLTPLDHESILADRHIDKILLPSGWTADYFCKLKPEIRGKIYIWPAGSECNIEQLNIKKEYCLIFKKKTEEKLFEDIKEYLQKKNIAYQIIEYGKYKRKEYFQKLEKSRFVIYLQESESQGVALQEAWAHNVPTLVWSKGYFIHPVTGEKIYGKISAPYLTDECGQFFRDSGEFKNILPSFIAKLDIFKPAEYCKKNLSIERSAEIYVNIIDGKQAPMGILQ